MADLELDDIRCRVGGKLILDGVRFRVDEGEFCVVVGPSGSGKSTLLRVVAGLEPAASGRVAIGSRDVSRLSPRERDVAFVFQSYALYPHLTVRQNLEFPLKVRGVPSAERAKRAREAAELLRIGELLDRRPRELSGGEQQRVAIGRAVVRRPKLFLFDEPLSNLDARLRARMRVELIELHRALGVTAVFVTHDQAEAMVLGQKVIVLSEGRIRQIGAPRDVYDRPVDSFVAGFLGSPPINFFEGTVRRQGAHLVFTAAEMALKVPGWLGEGPLVLGVRPEDLHPGDGPISFRVRLVENQGAEEFVHGDALGAAVVYRSPQGEPAPRTGDRVLLAIRSGKEHWFRDGCRIEPSS